MYKYELKKLCVGFNNLDLKFGDEVQIIKGITLHARPEMVIVSKEYDKYILLCMRFDKSFFDPDLPPRYVMTCMNKADMLCGDASLRRVKDGKIFTGQNVGVYRWL